MGTIASHMHAAPVEDGDRKSLGPRQTANRFTLCINHAAESQVNCARFCSTGRG